MTPSRSGPLVRRLLRSLGPAAGPLERVIAEAHSRGVGVFLVGGPVRDLLLGLPVRDLDVLLSDRLDEIAEAAGSRLSGRVRRHAPFLTATLEGGPPVVAAAERFRIDLSRARTESYPKPGVLPRVSPADSIEADLERRDFSVNAMALPLDAASGERLLDPHGGLADLEAGRLRVLHAQSFVDDPTRLYRAARYAARLRFRLEPTTARLAGEAVRSGTVDTLSGDRVRHELEHAVDEAQSARVLARSERLGLLGAAVRGWRLGPGGVRGLRRLDRAKETPPWPEAGPPEVLRATGMRLLLVGANRPIRARVLERLGVVGGPAERIELDLAGLRRRLGKLERPLSAGWLDAQLSGSLEPWLLLLWCVAPRAVQGRVARFATSLRHEELALDGHAARALGARGPEVGELLREARRRTLDGEVADEVWGRRWLARRRQMG